MDKESGSTPPIILQKWKLEEQHERPQNLHECAYTNHDQELGKRNVKFVCDLCRKFSTNRRDNMNRHHIVCINYLCKIADENYETKFVCMICRKYRSKRTFNMKRHRLACLKKLVKSMSNDIHWTPVNEEKRSCMNSNHINKTDSNLERYQLTCDKQISNSRIEILNK